MRLLRASEVNLVTDTTTDTLGKKVSDSVVRELVNAIHPKLQKPPEILEDTKVEVTPVGTKVNLRNFLQFKKPNESNFYVSADVWRQCLFTIARGKNVMFTGPAGSGKTELGKMLGKQCQRNVETFDFGAMTEPRISLIGSGQNSPEKGTYFVLSRFAKIIAIPNTVIILDELSRAPMSAANILLPVLDARRELAVDEEGTVIKVAEGVCFLATANVGTEYTGTSSVDRALRDRFSQIEIEFPPEKQEISVLCTRTKVPEKFATYLVNIANKQRKMATKEMIFVEQISTRMLLMAAEQLVFGIPFQEAMKYAIAGMFSNEGNEESDRFKINQLITSVVDKKDLNFSMV